MKQYKLDTKRIKELDRCFTIGYYSYGHHEKNVFADAIKYDWDLDESIEEIVKRTVHQWVKLVPWRGTKQMMMIYSKEYKKGYTPITVFEF